MDSAHYTDPLEDALSHSSQRVAQFASLMGAMAQVALQRKSLADAKNAARNDRRAARALSDQERLLRQQTRLSWAPAHDPRWLSHADLLQTARAWGGAACYADADPTAASAMRKCEDRLRTLHPYAMARYDRLREDGMNPLDAMRETAPLFGRASHVRVGDPAVSRPALNARTDHDADPSDDQVPDGPPEPEPEADVPSRSEQRGRQIIERLQASARAANRAEPSPGELAMILEAVTNLPYEVIENLTRQATAESRGRSEERRAADAEWARAFDLGYAVDEAVPLTDERAAGLAAADHDTGIADSAMARAGAGRSAAQVAAESFPHTAADAVHAAASGGPRQAGRTTAPVPALDIGKRPGPSL